MAIQQIDVVSVPVSDQERAKAFYLDTLGFRLVRDNPMGPEQRWIQVVPPGGGVSLTLVTWFPTMTPGALKGLVLQTDDIHADYAALAARGLAFHGAIQEEGWGTFATFDDLDGNGWVLSQSR